MPVTSTPWKVLANSYSNGVTSGYLSGVKFSWNMLTCTAKMSGRLAVKYTNATGKLDVSDDATYKVTVDTVTAGCAGILAMGDNWKYSTSYSVVTPAGGTVKPTLVHAD
ncbi:hypothetical protein AB0N93_05520 [Streptomyces sp. NPDC091267]|uniref:hypothetical protein n=1 Tax=unclassified Streptomyces TaxID=2593676 RepID=UPI00342CAE77